MNDLADLRAQLLHARTALVRQLAAVEAELADVEARYHKLTQYAPILRLPHELLVLLFDYTRARWRPPPAFEVIASHVCSRWRDIAIGLPRFWSTIDLNLRVPTSADVHRLDAYLFRSDPLPLDIFIACHVLDPLLPPLLPHASRWRQLCIVSDSNIQPTMLRLSVPILEFLSFRINHIHDASSHLYSNIPSLLPQILPSTPSLSFLRLAGTALWTLQPSMINVRTLHLEGRRPMFMSIQQFRTLMATLPSLVNLSLSHISIDAPQQVDNGRNPTLTSLRRLRICDEDRQSGIILSLVDLPAVESLHLRNIEAFDPLPLPTIRSVAFDSCPFLPNELWDTTRAFPAVSSLTMDQSVEALYALLGTSDGQIKWPELKTMTIYDLIPSNVQVFCDMVEVRQQVGKPLTCIRLNRRGRNVLKNKGRLQWLCDRVAVENHNAEEAWPPGLEFHDPDDP
ncbi:hypothetical protein APHAL10511_007461 [Amanita phalloides]|nr:hypothetical protein APHAL10511_007461 [Amanita phalloides]